MLVLKDEVLWIGKNQVMDQMDIANDNLHIYHSLYQVSRLPYSTHLTILSNKYYKCINILLKIE